MSSINRGARPSSELVRADAVTAFPILKADGLVLLPLDVSCAIFGHTSRAVKRVFDVKNRTPTKSNGGGQKRRGIASGVFDQQLCLEARVDCRSVSRAPTAGLVHQVDQTAFAHPGVLWPQRERSEDRNRDCYFHLCVDRHQKEICAP